MVASSGWRSRGRLPCLGALEREPFAVVADAGGSDAANSQGSEKQLFSQRPPELRLDQPPQRPRPVFCGRPIAREPVPCSGIDHEFDSLLAQTLPKLADGLVGNLRHHTLWKCGYHASNPERYFFPQVQVVERPTRSEGPAVSVFRPRSGFDLAGLVFTSDGSRGRFMHASS